MLLKFQTTPVLSISGIYSANHLLSRSGSEQDQSLQSAQPPGRNRHVSQVWLHYGAKGASCKGLSIFTVSSLSLLISLESFQSDFRPHHSTETSLPKRSCELPVSKCNGRDSVLIFLGHQELTTSCDTLTAQHLASWPVLLFALTSKCWGILGLEP